MKWEKDKDNLGTHARQNPKDPIIRHNEPHFLGSEL